MAIYWKRKTIEKIHKIFTDASEPVQPSDMQFFVDVNVFDLHISSVRKKAKLFQHRQNDYMLLVNIGPIPNLTTSVNKSIGFTQKIDQKMNRFALTSDGERVKDKCFEDSYSWFKYKQCKRIRNKIGQWIKSNFGSGAITGAFTGFIFAVLGSIVIEYLKNAWFPNTGVKLKGK